MGAQARTLTSLFPGFPIFQWRLNHLLYLPSGDLWGVNEVMQMVNLGKVHIAIKYVETPLLGFFHPENMGKLEVGISHSTCASVLENGHCSLINKEK